MGILMKVFMCLSLLLFCSYIKASARDNPISRRIRGPSEGIHRIDRPCVSYKPCRRGDPPHGVGKQVVDNKPAKKSVIEPQGRSGYNGGLP
ncbi:unnamed protein product [Amaranthus hypochondriacus]